MNNKFYSLLGISKKSANMSNGSFAVEKSIKSGLAYLVIIADDAAKNTAEKFKNLCESKKIPLLIQGKKELIGRSIGKNDTSVVSINDLNLSNEILNIIKKLQNDGGE
ncbi:ribosomal L7Ae/L30e/S12e/Gadd45 family protein [Aceticella autotrophica]|uniref:Ribosomal L7Ae/L30e/S12e/Gadd45 family protein n=1 Tax=Aceticella autotrophica TaxID=2755338 RepID=A0A975GB82_9THEO|nr:ribosomal L7Ae/L30e/S12e/Gadd45 family protein [Aceticella autotrophica]QSZ28254.1 ribosomal L7Ae/L30e/S12e/Gadd45 family protein [Aceticella autotrophica]